MKGFCVIKEIKIVRVERFPVSAFQASDFALGASLSATTQQVEIGASPFGLRPHKTTGKDGGQAGV
jgi:hypothetical protein